MNKEKELKPRILIVEDEVLIADEINDLLCRNEYDVIAQVTGGEEALAVAASKQPDIVIMDIKLRGEMDGITAAEKIYQQWGISCIFLTSYSDPSLLKRAKKVGAFGYLVKPFDDFELMAMIDMVFYKVKMETEKRHLEGQLQQAMKMETIGTLAGGIAHDFNNILAGIMGYSELIEEDMKYAGMETANIREVINASRRAKDLIQQILMFSHKGERNPDPTDLKTVIKETENLLRATIPSTIETVFNLPKAPMTTLVDPSQILQVIMNLCTNAAQAMETTGGRIVVSLDRIPSDAPELNAVPERFSTPLIHLSVSDNGPGIPMEIQKRVFDPYYTTKAVGKGSGLGLSVVHGIVKQSGGAIRLESAEGKGCAFHLYLPETGDSGGTAREDTPKRPASGEGHILLVDDEEMVLNMGKLMLTRLGYSVTTATCGDEALKIFSTDPGRFDAVMTDQTMPAMTGLALAARLVAIRADIPILLCSGDSIQVDKESAAGRDIKASIMKPFLRRELETTLHDILRNGS